ncbi:hypothetical protein D9757_009903 [Collybiopsis confluens]|uniref:Uncharacterized protein n=1 Tax=Collybiopsis confluens TaxID=2823264 RepID=A0A8H5GWM9_9AGAR|nr:hypothetical protein D9757_009903 [Collybiopsis confluens]
MTSQGRVSSFKAAAQWQAAQVSTFSFMNFSGRIIIGPIQPPEVDALDPRSVHLAFIADRGVVYCGCAGSVVGNTLFRKLGIPISFTAFWWKYLFWNLDAHERDPNQSTSSFDSRVLYWHSSLSVSSASSSSSLAPPSSTPSQIPARQFRMLR